MAAKTAGHRVAINYHRLPHCGKLAPMTIRPFCLTTRIGRDIALLVILSASLLLQPPARAMDSQPIRQAIGDFLQRQSATLPGKASSTIGAINAQSLPDCRQLEVTMADSSRPWGRTNVLVSCLDGANWRLYVPVQIHVAVDYLVSARAIRGGQILEAADLTLRPGDLYDLPASVLTDAAQAIGQISVTALPAGSPIRRDLLRAPLIIQQGQTVKVVSTGVGFQVNGEGQAQNGATVGQMVKVRLPSGRIISGTATSDGSVAIAY
jgi:flagella basal body P-ring formation protein FlgA